jgi:hypothetical protein
MSRVLGLWLALAAVLSAVASAQGGGLDGLLAAVDRADREIDAAYGCVILSFFGGGRGGGAKFFFKLLFFFFFFFFFFFSVVCRLAGRR